MVYYIIFYYYIYIFTLSPFLPLHYWLKLPPDETDTPGTAFCPSGEKPASRCLGKRKKFTTGIPVDLRGTILTILS